MLKDIAHYIADIAYNSLRAGASRLDITVDLKGDGTTLVISDDVGADKEKLIEASQKEPSDGAVSGLGLPYLRKATLMHRGKLNIDSDSSGTTVEAEFSPNTAIGNLGDAIATLLTEEREVRITFTLISGDDVSTTDVSETLKELGEKSLPVAIKLLKELINSNQKSILGGTTV